MTNLQLALVLATFLLAVATFWMAYESREHVRLARAQYLADRAPLIKPRVKSCGRHRDLLSAELAIQNVGANTLVIHGVGVRSQNDRRPGSSSPAPEYPYRMAVATLYPGHEASLHLDLPVSNDDLTGGEQIGVWTLHVYLSIRGFPETLEVWAVFAFILYEAGEFRVKLTTFGPTLDERTALEKLRDWFRRMRQSAVHRLGRRKRQSTSLNIFRQ